MRRRTPPRSFPIANLDLHIGCYSLVIALSKRKTISVGRLGVETFPQGTYVYTGSAMNGLSARLLRHLRRKKKLHWHIDYLLASAEARIERIFVYPSRPDQECRQNQKIAALSGAAIVVRGFGATDCRRGCASHLVYFAPTSQLELTRGKVIPIAGV